MEVAEVLVAHGADVNARVAGDRSTVLACAISEDRTEIAELLIDAGANVTAEVKERGAPTTLLSLAVDMGNTRIAEKLMSRGAAIDDSGAFPLHDAAAAGRTDIVRLLMAKGARINRKDDLGRTPLDLAEENAHKPVVALLRKYGAKRAWEIK